jgi:2-keto-4-pentenoate hydratase/2-oxohepta-3-ene-1,7-dioic acid hydratase in catechol pathway
MRFVAYRPLEVTDPRRRYMGLVIGDRIAPLTDLDGFYDDVPGWKIRARNISEGEIPVSEVKLAPPVPRDAKIICAAVNYPMHGAESGLALPTFPNLFARWTSEIVTDGEKVPVPLAEHGLDWEVELAAIIGAPATDASAAEAADSIFGYTVANDISARRAQRQASSLPTGQWGLGKNPERSAAFGSFIETADGIDVASLKLETIVDGEIMQSGTSADMIFSVSDIIAFASKHVTLRPGDAILTGTPDGVGAARNPPILMKAGASVTVRIAGLCSLTNLIVDSSHRG